jgi:molybdopterin-guanine dinucleotide biosynthesis protein A
MTADISPAAPVIAPDQITGVVLCGGAGRRMGGVQKPLLELDGRTLLDRVLERVRPQVGRIVISANEELPRYAAYGYEVIRDATPGLGPLGGLAACARVVTTPWIFVCAGDAPYLDSYLISRLALGRGPHDAGALPHDGERAHYLMLLVRTETCASIAPYLTAGHRSVRGWLSALPVREVALPALRESFRNLNTPDDLQATE